ncbi:hypothetical protein CYLTODRAFT_490928 [Cylindrobasidium torrendii FP15055 ss-10]|uniref:Uncharacterized protein n=1 Tax=Cylindrobasidium torrendii FP15055 ss-10 TaxID=1314674 RepID=A0A0D7BC36_9AGAR|nr:hypothetical protein CYLTODRAFT_490928 [Cylindrobasidium torrendii FP15055 ss-10]
MKSFKKYRQGRRERNDRVPENVRNVPQNERGGTETHNVPAGAGSGGVANIDLVPHIMRGGLMSAAIGSAVIATAAPFGKSSAEVNKVDGAEPKEDASMQDDRIG